MILPPRSICPACRYGRSALVLGLLAAVATTIPLTTGRAEEAADVDFTKLSLEELMDVEVTSVSKHPQRVADAAAAIFVITPEDIRRSGANSVPELLRMVPGVEVARIDATKWAVSIRGFNDRFASKVLVLVDGRSVYNVLSSGAYWEAQDVVLEDVERIEVIRGPAATMWGANAMNGIINIITKSARDTQGALFSGGVGTNEHGGTARFGGKVGDKLHYRGYGKSFQIDDGALPSGDRGADETHQVRTGFRIDAEPTGRDLFTLSGDLYRQDYGSTIPQPITAPPYLLVSDDRGKSSGGNVLGRWSRHFSEVSSAALQVYYDRFEKSEQGIGLKTDVADIDFQHELEPFAANHVIWGVGYHYTRVSVDDSPFFRTTSNYRKDSQFGGFIQDEISLIEDELRLTIGSKVEHNDSTGAEIQPSARVLWSPTMRQSAWAGVSRAVRLPFIAEEEVDMTYRVEPPFTPENPGALPVEIRFLGNPGIVAEDVLSFEVGYRAQPSDRLSLDTTAFYNFYDGLRAFVTGTPFFAPTPDPRVVVPARWEDNQSAETWGVEVAADWKVFAWWRLKAAYTYLHEDLKVDSIGHGMSPLHQASLRSMLDLGDGWEFDLWPRYVDNLTAYSINSYVSLDARLGWRPKDSIEFSLVGQNLLDSRREEFVSDLLPVTATQVERAAYGKLTLRF